MKLKLDLEGTEFVLSLIPKDVIILDGGDWYDVDFKLYGKYINYARNVGVFDKDDLEEMVKALNNEGRMKPDETESFGSEVWFELFPTWQVPKRKWCGNMTVCVVNTDEYGLEELTGTEIKFELDGSDIFALKTYLQYVLGEVDESDDCVKDLMQQGMLI